ncbi:MAG: OmpH family outer membrane protein [Chitinophagaceae bacterium]|nr:OmpH family outer membrane protein [Chitinophagaceae bacterium]
MKQISTVLSIVALVGTGILYYLHFSHSEKVDQRITRGTTGKKDSTGVKIAYFDIDSLQKNFKSFKEAEEDIKSKESGFKNELTDLNNRNQRRLRELQERAPAMTQAEGEAAQRELAELTQRFQQKEMELDQKLKTFQMDKITDLQKKVEVYLKKYNQQKGYSFILSYRPGEFMYYKDSAYDVTREIVDGLNQEYPVKKKE